MEKSLPLFNWSFRRALETESDNFVRARIRIIYVMLLFSLLKALVVVGFGAMSEQWHQVLRAGIAFVFYAVLTKVLLSRPSRLKSIVHIMLQLGIILTWTNVFVYSHTVNLITIQFVFMIIMSSFYVLGSWPGVLYSIASASPIILFLLFRGYPNALSNSDAHELTSPAHEIIVVLNFVTITLAHYLFYKAFRTNIQEKEKLNQQLQLSIAEAHQLAMSKSNFLSTMSHELRTPLNAVIGISELLQDDNLEVKQKEKLKILQSSSRDLLSLINNILDFNKADSGKFVLESVPFNLVDLVRDTSSGLKIKANDKQLNFVLDIDDSLIGVNIISDPTRISQLIYNLAGNAIKFTEKGSVTVKLECANRTDNTVQVVFSVADTGIGIPADAHETIFEAFTQAEAKITRKYGGSGLGLSIVKQVLEIFNSKIQLESSLGKGARFFFTISFDIAPDIRVKKVEAEEALDVSHLKMLVAEDNEVNRIILKKQLSKLNIQPLMVENGQLAYEALLANDFDVVLMDLHMPVSDGYGTIKMMRSLADREKAETYIIAFTASVTEQQQIFEAGFNDFLYKPVQMNDLREKLEKVSSELVQS